MKTTIVQGPWGCEKTLSAASVFESASAMAPQGKRGREEEGLKKEGRVGRCVGRRGDGPVKRIGTPESYAKVCCFHGRASEESGQRVWPVLVCVYSTKHVITIKPTGRKEKQNIRVS